MPPPPPPKFPVYHWRNIHPNARILYVRDITLANSLIDALTGPVGFDLEWKPIFTKNTPENPVAIVQLANETNILVIQVSAMPEFPTKLRDFLGNPGIVKAGVGIQNDAKKLYRDWQISLRNCVDLSLLARCADNPQWKGKYRAPLGLARLVENYESLALPKGRISRSNWEGQLTSKEVDYAGNDAHAGFLLYQKLITMANALDKVPKPVYYSFNFVRDNFCEPSGMHWNCHNPDYDPGPPPPPKPPKPPTARDVRRMNAKAAAKLSTLPGKSQMPALFPHFEHPPHAKAGGAASFPPPSPSPEHRAQSSDTFPSHRREIVQPSDRDTLPLAANTMPNNRRRRRLAKPVPDA
ncbi:hypothetical protein C0991_008773 [Blastosporella zonata]|nr:hypothetical protein C0991_008773 [Blastosporella zonata]